MRSPASRACRACRSGYSSSLLNIWAPRRALFTWSSRTAALRALARESLPPVANLQTPDAAFDLDFVRGEAREAKGIRYALSNSFAFGGTNAVIVAGRADALDR